MSLSVILLVLILVLALLSIFVALWKREGSGSIVVKECYWLVNSTRVVEARHGDVVTAVVVLSTPTNFNGFIEVRVKRDLKLLPDEAVAILKQYYIIGYGEEVIVKLRFKTEYSIIARGYFIEVKWRNGKYSMVASYPPRLRILKD